MDVSVPVGDKSASFAAALHSRIARFTRAIRTSQESPTEARRGSKGAGFVPGPLGLNEKDHVTTVGPALQDAMKWMYQAEFSQ